jgi:ABC-type sugar transport system ATPase subunit
MSQILEIKKLYKKFNHQVIAQDLSLTVNQGDIISIMGKSGIGKTTLLRMIAGLEKPDKGIIIIDHKIVNEDYFSIEPFKRGIGFVFQNATLWPHMTMSENINFALSEAYHDKKNEIIRLLGIQAIMEKYPDEVSEGEGKRVSVARAICSGAKLLLMDEPFSNLDSETKLELIDLIKALHQKTGLSILLVSHNIDENKAMANQIYELTDGALYEKKI